MKDYCLVIVLLLVVCSAYAEKGPQSKKENIQFNQDYVLAQRNLMAFTTESVREYVCSQQVKPETVTISFGFAAATWRGDSLCKHYQSKYRKMD